MMDNQSLRQNLTFLNVKETDTLKDKTCHFTLYIEKRFLTNWIKEKWIEYGYDSISLSPSQFLLSYPKPEQPNKIYLYDSSGKVMFTSKHKEDVNGELGPCQL